MINDDDRVTVVSLLESPSPWICVFYVFDMVLEKKMPKKKK